MKKIIFTVFLLLVVNQLIFGNILFSIVQSGSSSAWKYISKMAVRIAKTIQPRVQKTICWFSGKSLIKKGGENSLEKLLLRIWDDLAKAVKGLFKNSKHVLDLAKISIMAFFGYKVNQGVTYMKTHSALDTLKTGSEEAWDFALNNTTLLLLLLIFIPQFRELLFFIIGKVFSLMTYILNTLPGFLSKCREIFKKGTPSCKRNFVTKPGGELE